MFGSSCILCVFVVCFFFSFVLTFWILILELVFCLFFSLLNKNNFWTDFCSSLLQFFLICLNLWIRCFDMFCIFVLIVFGIFELYFFHVLRIATFNGVILLGVTQRSLMIGMYLYN